MDSCRKFAAIKYWIDDFLEITWQGFQDFEAVAYYGMAG
jgi:hypothetical protein